MISIHALLAESDGVFRCHLIPNKDFYPRSPCGERQLPTPEPPRVIRFLSTLSLRRATRRHKKHLISQTISIHALLAESDVIVKIRGSVRPDISIHALLAESDMLWPVHLARGLDFYPRSPCGERLKNPEAVSKYMIFLSTLSLRRATSDR